MGVYEYVCRDDIVQGQSGNAMPAKWDRVNKMGDEHLEGRCRLFDEELDYRASFGELFAGALNLTIIKLLSVVAERPSRSCDQSQMRLFVPGHAEERLSLKPNTRSTTWRRLVNGQAATEIEDCLKRAVRHERWGWRCFQSDVV